MVDDASELAGVGDGPELLGVGEVEADTCWHEEIVSPGPEGAGLDHNLEGSKGRQGLEEALRIPGGDPGLDGE